MKDKSATFIDIKPLLEKYCIKKKVLRVYAKVSKELFTAWLSSKRCSKPNKIIIEYFFSELAKNKNVEKLYEEAGLNYVKSIINAGSGKYIRKMGRTRKSSFGEDSRNYKDGISIPRNIAFEKYKMEKKCEKCGETEDLNVHHKNENRHDNSRENLKILCRSCHMKHHKIGGKHSVNTLVKMNKTWVKKKINHVLNVTQN